MVSGGVPPRPPKKGKFIISEFIFKKYQNLSLPDKKNLDSRIRPIGNRRSIFLLYVDL